MDRWRIEKVRRRAGVREKMSGRVEAKVLKLFGQVEGISGERLTKSVRVCVGKNKLQCS